MHGIHEKSPYPNGQLSYADNGIITGTGTTLEHDVFGDEAHHDIRYKTLSWQLVAVLMIAEIVSNGMLSLPSSGGVVGVCFLVFLFPGCPFRDMRWYFRKEIGTCLRLGLLFGDFIVGSECYFDCGMFDLE